MNDSTPPPPANIAFTFEGDTEIDALSGREIRTTVNPVSRAIQPCATPGDDRHRVVVTCDDIEMLACASKALNNRRSDLFVVGDRGSGGVVMVSAKGTRDLGLAEVTAILSSDVVWLRETKKEVKGEGDEDDERESKKRSVLKITRARPPVSVCLLLSRGNGSLRQLAGITSLPLLRSDGAVHAVPGWDSVSGLFVREGAEALASRVGSTVSEAWAAAGRLLAAVHGAPWKTDHDGFAWLGHVLTIAARPLIAGPVPAWVYDATEQNSGKTTLARVASWLLTGVDPIPVACSLDKQEIERLLGPRSDEAGVVLDNFPQGTVLRSPTLDAMLTSGSISYSLKFEKLVTRPFRAVLALTMNGATTSKDLARRSVLVSLSRGSDQAMPPGDLLTKLADRRESLACDALTIVRAWLVNGRPRGTGELSSFASWSEVVGGCMAMLGRQQWIGSVESAASELDTDDESVTAIVDLFAAWLEAESKRRKAAALAEKKPEPPEMIEATAAEIHASPLAHDLCKAIASDRNVPIERLDAKAIGMVLRRSTAWTTAGTTKRRLTSRKRDGRALWRIETGQKPSGQVD